MNDANPYRSPETASSPRPPEVRPPATVLGLASLLCALVFPVAFWVQITAVELGLKWFPIVLGMILPAQSIAALVLGLLSFRRTVSWAGLTGVVLGTVWIFALLAFIW